MGDKEIRFFDNLRNYTGIFEEYISYFPTVQEATEAGHAIDKLMISGESTPNYLRFPLGTIYYIVLLILILEFSP